MFKVSDIVEMRMDYLGVKYGHLRRIPVFRQFFCQFLEQSGEFGGALSACPLVVGADVPLAPLEPVAEGGKAVPREELLPPAIVRVQGGDGRQEAETGLGTI